VSGEKTRTGSHAGFRSWQLRRGTGIGDATPAANRPALTVAEEIATGVDDGYVYWLGKGGTWWRVVR
jgi:hypothetical protein